MLVLAKAFGRFAEMNFSLDFFFLVPLFLNF